MRSDFLFFETERSPQSVGVFGLNAQAVIVLALGRHALTGWDFTLIAIASAVLSLGTKIHPSVILIRAGTIEGSRIRAATVDGR